jgi:hypothetical protein
MKLTLVVSAFLATILAASPLLADTGAPARHNGPTSCAGTDPAVVSVVVKGATSVNGLDHYAMSGKVVNLGRTAQASNVLQFVDIYDDSYAGGQKKDAKGIPPLKPGQSYTFSYVSLRSSDAGKGTSKFAFQIDVHQPSVPGPQDCYLDNGRVIVTF